MDGKTDGMSLIDASEFDVSASSGAWHAEEARLAQSADGHVVAIRGRTSRKIINQDVSTKPTQQA